MGLALILSHEWAQMAASRLENFSFLNGGKNRSKIKGGRSDRCSSRGWGRKAPRTRRERERVRDKCGDYCFLGRDMSFPVCSKYTRKCRRDRAGVCAAKYRADQHDHKEIARKARRILEGGRKTQRKRGRTSKRKRGGSDCGTNDTCP